MFAEQGGALTASTDSIAQLHARQGYLNIHIKSCRFSHQAEPSAASHLLFLLHKDSVKLPTFSKLLHHHIKHPWVELFVSMKAHCFSLIFSSSSLSFNSSFSDLHHQLSPLLFPQLSLFFNISPPALYDVFNRVVRKCTVLSPAPLWTCTGSLCGPPFPSSSSAQLPSPPPYCPPSSSLINIIDQLLTVTLQH